MAQRVLKVTFEVDDKGSAKIQSASKRILSALKAIEAESKKANTAISKSTNALTDGVRKAESSTKRSTTLMGGYWKTLAGIISAVAIKNVTQSIIETGIEMERLSAFVKSSIQGWLDYNKTIGYVSDRAEELGLVFQTQIRDFGQLANVMRLSGYTADDLQTVFRGVTDAVAALQLSGEQAHLVMRGIIQVFNKGKVQAEELREQIGEKLPGAYVIFAKSLGMSQEELDKAMEQGQVYADSMINFARMLSEEFGRGAQEAAKLTSAAIGRMLSAWFKFKAAVAEGGLLESFRDVVEMITERLNDPKVIETFTKLSKIFSDLAMIIIDELIVGLDWLIKKIDDAGGWYNALRPIIKFFTEWGIKIGAIITALSFASTIFNKVIQTIIYLGAVIWGVIKAIGFFVKTWQQYTKIMGDATKIGNYADAVKFMTKEFAKLPPKAQAIIRAISKMHNAFQIFVDNIRKLLIGLLPFLTQWVGRAMRILGPFLAVWAGIKAAEGVGGMLQYKPPKDDAERLARYNEHLQEAIKLRDKYISARQNFIKAGDTDVLDELNKLIDIQNEKIELWQSNIETVTERMQENKKEIQDLTEDFIAMNEEISNNVDITDDHSLALDKEAEALKKLKQEFKEMIKTVRSNQEQYRKFIDALQELHINVLELEGDLTEARRLEEEKRFRNLRENLTREFGEYERFYELIELANQEHNLRMEQIERAEMARRAGRTRMTDTEFQGRQMLEAMKKVDELVKKREEEMLERWEAVKSYFGDAFGNMFSEIVSGTKSVTDAFTDMIKSMMTDLAKLAASAVFREVLAYFGGGGGAPGGFFGDMAQKLGGVILGRAGGGSVNAGQPYMVGERGPELFVPNTAGRVMANGGGGLTVVNNVTVSGQGAGGATQADQRNLGETITRMITEQTRVTILKETRPGGMLNRPAMGMR